MNATILYSCFLILHLTALIVLAGTTLIDYISYQMFWKLVDREMEKSMGVLQVITKSSRLFGIGGGILILTGLGMMILTHGVFGEQLWFRIKFVIVIILIINALVIGRRQGISLTKLMNDRNLDFTGRMSHIKTRINRFHISQLCLILVIIFLSVFKFH